MKILKLRCITLAIQVGPFWLSAINFRPLNRAKITHEQKIDFASVTKPDRFTGILEAFKS